MPPPRALLHHRRIRRRRARSHQARMGDGSLKGIDSSCRGIRGRPGQLDKLRRSVSPSIGEARRLSQVESEGKSRQRDGKLGGRPKDRAKPYRESRQSK
jgi:hypothetical protein